MTVKEFIDEAIKYGVKPDYRLMINGPAGTYLLLVNDMPYKTYIIHRDKVPTLLSFIRIIGMNNADNTHIRRVTKVISPIRNFRVDNEHRTIII